MRYEDLPEEQRLMADREDIRDSDRERIMKGDDLIDIAARKYLKSRGRRMEIERESGSKIDAFPYRLIEIIRARRFAKLAELELIKKNHRDDILPTLARITLDELSSDEIY